MRLENFTFIRNRQGIVKNPGGSHFMGYAAFELVVPNGLTMKDSATGQPVQRDLRLALKSVAVRATQDNKAHLGFPQGKPYTPTNDDGSPGVERAGASPIDIFDANTRLAVTHAVFAQPEVKTVVAELGQILKREREAIAAQTTGAASAGAGVPEMDLDLAQLGG